MPASLTEEELVDSRRVLEAFRVVAGELDVLNEVERARVLAAAQALFLRRESVRLPSPAPDNLTRLERDILAVIADGRDPYDAYPPSYRRFVLGAVRRLIHKKAIGADALTASAEPTAWEER
jgi:hypothetical protein